MNKKVLCAANMDAVNAVKTAIKTLRRQSKDGWNAEDVINMFEDFVDSFKIEEIANETNEEIEKRIVDSLKGANKEVITKAIDDAFAKRAEAKEIVDAKNDETYRKNFSNAVLNAIERKETLNLIDAVKRVDNSITTFVFPTEVETAIRKTWESHREILDIFKQTQRGKIPYTTQDQQDNDVLARIQSAPDVEKSEQNLVLSYVTISMDYFYKLNYIEKKDIMEARQYGMESALVAEIFAELTEQVIAGVVDAALITGASKGGSTFINSIARTSSDTWVTVTTASGATPTITEVRTASDAIMAEGERIFICDKATKTALETLASGQTTGLVYMPTETLLSQINCNRIITNELVGNLCMVVARDAYALRNFGIESQRFEKITFNKDGLISEMLCGGNMVAPKGASVILPVALTLVITSSGAVSIGTGTLADDTYVLVKNGHSESITLSSGTASGCTIAAGTYRVVKRGKYLSLIG